ncbi:hypothetical protein RUM44_003687 [Polyplax serrata]|uniref:Uncharacterized protein n=1 Tax=Polyplax serrata TaxID=468196 RepID=A0ABR1AH72_POLSC
MLRESKSTAHVDRPNEKESRVREKQRGQLIRNLDNIRSRTQEHNKGELQYTINYYGVPVSYTIHKQEMCYYLMNKVNYVWKKCGKMEAERSLDVETLASGRTWAN